MRLTLHTVGRIRLTVHPVLWYKSSRVLPICQDTTAKRRLHTRPNSDYAADVGFSPASVHLYPPMTTQYPPRHLTAELHVSDSTLRRWSEVFARHLSPSATTAPRRYTEQDVAVMRRIAALSDSGMRIAEIDAILDQPEPQPTTEPTAPPTEPPTTAVQAFSTLTETLHAQQVTQTAIATTLAGLADVAALRAELAELRTRVARLEGAAHTHSGLVRGKPL